MKASLGVVLIAIVAQGERKWRLVVANLNRKKLKEAKKNVPWIFMMKVFLWLN